MNIEIRRAVPADASQATELAHRAKAHWGYPPTWIERWKADLTLTEDYLGKNSGFVALHEGLLVGVCVLERKGSGWSLEHVWVAPEFHHRGIGRQLVERTLATALDTGASSVDVLSDPFAEPFYLALGARRVGLVPAPIPEAPARMLPQVVFDL
jgi:GNAT superfamily N-acetyltransferase